jgi:hypothetical protein
MCACQEIAANTPSIAHGCSGRVYTYWRAYNRFGNSYRQLAACDANRRAALANT